MYKIQHNITPLLCRWVIRARSYSSNGPESEIKRIGSRNKSKEEEEEEEIPSYLRSPASRYRAEASRRGTAAIRLWYEPYVIVGSLAVLLAYFGFLREENDIDVELSRSLYERVAGLEEMQLEASLVHERNRGGDTTAITRRLEEIQRRREIGGSSSTEGG